MVRAANRRLDADATGLVPMANVPFTHPHALSLCAEHEKFEDVKVRSALVDNLYRQLEQIPFLQSRIRRLEADLASAEGAIDQLNSRLADRHLELARTTKALLLEEECSEEEKRASAQLLGILRTIMTDAPWWWYLMPKSWRGKRVASRLARQGLFDAEAYAAQFPDVSAGGQEPLRHFVFHGFEELRTGAR